MTYEQIALFSLIGLVLVGLLWGRWRYDLVAFTALMIGVAIGAVPHEIAFTGFGHEATIIVALVLIISAGLSRSGAVDLITRLVIDRTRALGQHITILGTVGGILSAFMNNVATLALLMPVDIQAARQAGRSPSRSLMPLSFATILGGMATLIGTPPNIIIASYRGDAMGTPFAMFDFAPVGATVAIVGVIFIALIGWRLIPEHPGNSGLVEDLSQLDDYVAELVVTEKSRAVGEKVRDLDEAAEEADCAILGLVRNGKRLPGRARREEIAAGDLLVVQGTAEALNTLSGSLGLKMQGKAGQVADLSADMTLAEFVITRDSRLIGRRANEVQLLRAGGASVIGLSRMGKAVRERLRRTPLQAGDVLLLLGTEESMMDVANRLQCLPLADRSLNVTRHEKAWGAIGLFGGAIALAAFGLIPLPIALGMVAIGLVIFDILPLRDLYDAVEWPVIVLLGAMIPLGAALESSGGSALIVQGLAAVTEGLPGWVAIMVLLVATMTLSDVLNNTATAVIAAPIAVELARALGASPDPFLMAVAIGASCAFLTPIGHKNNMLILGPGGYAFGDYWRLGLPLEILVVAVSVPMIMLIWPL
ncbi:SLC13 family permease [Mariluticola halotolerans]|uniref:SLC13 family permease n=1 Tax=Mariluticola halotolerans TaxID=2909283 RepID=UPI0026E1CB27|nr:SLC13 family permease [Mariluticola halotolerans]UJQ93840.1 SLC13 family permease [Mariluticola halotolerans]